MSSITTIIGYTLESAVIARKLANDGTHIKFIQTDKFSSLHDDTHEVLLQSSYEKIIATEVDCTFKPHYDVSYIHVPYDQLKLVNDMNGAVSYPFNNTTFGTAEELEEVLLKIDEILTTPIRSKSANNLINLYKKCVPRWLFDSLIKDISINKWKQKHSNLTKEGLHREILFFMLTSKTPPILYYPIGGFKHLYEKLLDHKNIEIEYKEIDYVKDLIRINRDSNYYIIMDNRIDYILNYMCGKLDRVKFSIEKLESKSSMEEYKCIDSGYIITPNKEYWLTTSFDNYVNFLYSDVVIKLGSQEHTEIVPSINNVKIISEYQKLIQRFPNKQFILPTPLTFSSIT